MVLSVSSTCISRGSKGRFVSNLIVLMLLLLVSCSFEGREWGVSALQNAPREAAASPTPFFTLHNAILYHNRIASKSPNESSLRVSIPKTSSYAYDFNNNKKKKRANTIDDLLSSSSSSFDGFSNNGGHHQAIEEVACDPRRILRLCDNERSFPQNKRIIQ